MQDYSKQIYPQIYSYISAPTLPKKSRRLCSVSELMEEGLK